MFKCVDFHWGKMVLIYVFPLEFYRKSHYRVSVQRVLPSNWKGKPPLASGTILLVVTLLCLILISLAVFIVICVLPDYQSIHEPSPMIPILMLTFTALFEDFLWFLKILLFCVS